MPNDDEMQKSMALNALAANFGKEFPQLLLDMWLDLLLPYPVEQVEEGVKIVIEHYEYKTLPPFAVLKKAMDEAVGVGEKFLHIQATAEWAWLVRAIAENGSYTVPQMHETTSLVLRLMGGWNEACAWPITAFDFKRRDFIQLWKESHGKAHTMELGALAASQTVPALLQSATGP